VGGSQNHFTLQKQTPLLTHCTNPRPLNFIGLDNSVRNPGVQHWSLNGAGKAQAEIAACHATQIFTKIQPGHRLASFKIYCILYFGPQLW
jgi:hypothetical protein